MNLSELVENGRFLAAVSTKEAGNQSFTLGKDVSEVNANRARFLNSLAIPRERVYFARVNHTSNIAVLSFLDNNTPKLERAYGGERFVQPPDMESGFDGYLSFTPGWFVAYSLADCVPLFIWHDESGLFGLIHAGLLGVLNRIVNGLQAVYRDYDIDVATVRYHLGPCISRENYQLNKSGLWRQIRENALRSVPDIDRYLFRSGDTETIDLRMAVIDQLMTFGTPRDRITQDDRCTAMENSPFFSNHSAKVTGTPNGRFMVINGSRP